MKKLITRFVIVSAVVLFASAGFGKSVTKLDGPFGCMPKYCIAQ